MGFLRLCNNDDLLILLKDTFKACPIKIPEERIKPMVVFSEKRKKYKYIGSIENLLNDTNPINIQNQVSQMANLSVTKTKSIDTELGLKVMNGFLQGFGSDGASLDFAFRGVQKISFSFQNVNRTFIDIGELCNVLTNRKFNLSNPINKAFLNETHNCIVVDSVIRSNNFTINVEETNQTDFKFDIPEIQNILSSQGDKISTKSLSNLNISFQGEISLAFAFSGFVLNCDEDGTVYYDGEPDQMNLTTEPDLKTNFIPSNTDLIDSDFGLLEIE